MLTKGLLSVGKTVFVFLAVTFRLNEDLERII